MIIWSDLATLDLKKSFEKFFQMGNERSGDVIRIMRRPGSDWLKAKPVSTGRTPAVL